MTTTMTENPLFTVEDLSASYGGGQVLNEVSMAIESGEVVSLIGRNGAGKTTTLRSIAGIVRPVEGTITFAGEDITDLPSHSITKRGISYVPEDRQVFPDLTVEENLRLGNVATDDGLLSIEEVYERFPRLEERRSQAASHLSGGEQQMLTIARAIQGDTTLLLLDEPTEGLAPKIIDDIVDVVREIQSLEGVAILVVEQNLEVAMALAERHYVLNKGQVVFEGATDELEAAEDVRQRYLGVEI